MFQFFRKLFENRRFYYSDYKKSHDFKYQEIVCLDDLIDSFSKFFEDKINDVYMIKVNELAKRLRTIFQRDEKSLYLYEDQTYEEQYEIFDFYCEKQELFEELKLFNILLFSHRIFVEQTFDLIQNLRLKNDFDFQLRFFIQFVMI